jgi:hypothetical protein
MPKTSICLLTFIFFINLCSAQEPGRPNELDKLYTPLGNQVNTSSGKKSSSSSSFDGTGTFIKINPALLLRNTWAVGVEQYLGDYISLQANIGYQYGRDYISEFSAYMSLNPFDKKSSSIELPNIYSIGAFHSGGLFLAAAAKVVFNPGDYGSLYGEFGVRRNSTSIMVNQQTASGHYMDYYIKGNNYVNLQHTMFYLNYGYQFITEGRIKTSHELYLGFGANATSYNVFESNKIQVDRYGYGFLSEVENHYATGRRENHWNMTFLAGYVFGIGF